MTTQATPGSDIDRRLTQLETTLALFMEEQGEWRAQFVEEQREWRTRVAEDQQEWRREFNAGLNRMETRIDKLDANINRLYFATFSVVGALAVAVIVTSIFS